MPKTAVKPVDRTEVLDPAHRDVLVSAADEMYRKHDAARDAAWKGGKNPNQPSSTGEYEDAAQILVDTSLAQVAYDGPVFSGRVTSIQIADEVASRMFGEQQLPTVLEKLGTVQERKASLGRFSEAAKAKRGFQIGG